MADERADAPAGNAGASEEGRSCTWCGSAAPAGTKECPACGAALATRDALGGLIVPGVTAVDPALAAYDAQPWRIPKASPSQGLAGGTMAAAALGGPAGLAALGGLAAVAAVEYLGAGQGHPDGPSLDAIGRPSEAAVAMARQLDGDGDAGGVDAPPEDSPEARPGVPPDERPESGAASGE